MKPFLYAFVLFWFAFNLYSVEAKPKKIPINSKNAPKPIGPYSQAIKTDGLLFVSGQIAINPATNEMTLDNIETEARQVMENIKAILTEAGYEMKDIVKSTIYLTDLSHFAIVNEIYGSYFEGNYPARETVQVTKLPKGARIEISVIAYK